jgi:hypothetical protein
MHRLEWQQYERRIFEKLQEDFLPEEFSVEHDVRVSGRYSGASRQCDIGVFRIGEGGRELRMVADAKCYRRPVGIGVVEAFFGRLDDLGCRLGALVCPNGYSKHAVARAAAFDAEMRVVTLDEALEANWREVAARLFPWDPAFHLHMAVAFRALEQDDSQQFMDALEQAPHEEWLCVVGGATRSPALRGAIVRALGLVAQLHHDSGWRFNAIQVLHDLGELGRGLIAELLAAEQDEETRELLGSLLTR